MTITRILLQDGVGEMRAAALAEDGRPVALFMDRWSEREARIRWGDVTEARLKKLVPDQGGGFLMLASGEEAFMPTRHLGTHTEGAKLDVCVVAEARRDKLARVQPEENGGDDLSPFERWQVELIGTEKLEPETGPDAEDLIEAAFDEAIAPSVMIPGGGRLRITPTPALVALDIDSAGRKDRGRVSARAFQLNMDASTEAARQLALRSLGGPAVLDCVDRMASYNAVQVKTAFLEHFRAMSPRQVRALKPSPFGLMEATLEWRERPIAEALLNLANNPTDETILLDGLRRLEREARAQPAARLTLELPDLTFQTAKSQLKVYDKVLDKRYGARCEIVRSDREKAEVTAR